MSYRMALYIIDSMGRQFKPVLCMVGWWTIKGRPWIGLGIQNGTLHNRLSGGFNSSRFCAWWGGGQSKVGLVIQNDTLHNRFSGAAIQADSVYGGVVDNQR